jgi:hypothetical protein
VTDRAHAGDAEAGPIFLDETSIERLADALAARLERRGIAVDYLSPEDVAREFRVERGWVYAHKRELGAEPLGDGPRPRLRFRRSRVEAFLAAAGDGSGSPPPPRRIPRPPGGPVELLPIRGRSA